MASVMQWLDGSPTRFEVMLIALVFAMLCGMGAESAAKQYARDLLGKWRDRL